MIVKDTKKFPKEAFPRILIIGIEDWVEKNHIIMFIEDIPCVKHIKVKQYIKDITIIEWSKKRCAWVKIEKFNICESIANFFYYHIKKKYPSKNSKGEKIEVFLSYNLLELTKSNWYGIIIRNIPQSNSADAIKNFCEKYVNKDSVKYCSPPVLIKNIYCCIVVLNELENAEKLCINLNNFEISKKRKLKVNFHPLICKIRNNFSGSFFNSMFNENGYKFSDEVEQSYNVIPYSIPLPLLYSKVNDNRFNNEYNNREEGEIKDDVNLKKDIRDKEDKKNFFKGNSISFQKKSENSLKLNNNSLLSFSYNLSSSSSNTLEMILNGFQKLKEIGKKKSDDKNTKETNLEVGEISTEKSKNNYNNNNDNQETIDINKLNKNNNNIKNNDNNINNYYSNNNINNNNNNDDNNDFEYDQADIDYYTYNMKDKSYYTTKNFMGDIESKRDKIDWDVERNKLRNRNIDRDKYRERDYIKEDKYHKNEKEMYYYKERENNIKTNYNKKYDNYTNHYRHRSKSRSSYHNRSNSSNRSYSKNRNKMKNTNISINLSRNKSRSRSRSREIMNDRNRSRSRSRNMRYNQSNYSNFYKKNNYSYNKINNSGNNNYSYHYDRKSKNMKNYDNKKYYP